MAEIVNEHCANCGKVSRHAVYEYTVKDKRWRGQRCEECGLQWVPLEVLEVHDDIDG